MQFKKYFLLLTVLTSTFAFTSFVQADGDHSNHSADVSNAISNFRGNEQPSGNPHSNMNHGDSHEDQANIHNDDHSTSGHGGEGHSDSVIEETPPNSKVLGTFGLINMSFLGLGLMLKLRKRKESLYEAIK